MVQPTPGGFWAWQKIKHISLAGGKKNKGNGTMINARVIEEQDWIAQELEKKRLEPTKVIIKISSWGAPLVALSLFIGWLLLRDYTQLLFYAFIVAVLAVASWTYMPLAQSGKAVLGGVLYLGWFLIMSALCVYLVPDLLPGVMVCYILVTVLSNTFLGRRAYLGFSVTTLIFFTANMHYINNPQSHLFEPLPYHIGAVFGALTGAATFLALTYYVRMVYVNQDKYYVEALKSRSAIEQKAEAESKQRQLLQQTITDYVDVMSAVGQGDLSARIFIQEKAAGDQDPLIALGRQLNQTIANLQTMIQQIGEAAANLSSAASEILAAMTQQAAGTSEQSAAISQTTTVVQEVRVIAEQAVDRAQEVVETAQHTAEISRSGQTAVRETIAGMNRIKERVESISLNILELSEQTQRIGEIITTVNDLASQSNLLALNAAVEAARAGEQGKSFAVVAAEVRSLAEQSKRATSQIKAILQDIQKSTNASVMATEEGIKVVEQGVHLTERSQQTIAQLAETISESVERMKQVMAGGRQQATGMEQISAAMASILQVSAQSMASTRQSERSAQDLNHLAERLKQSLARYEKNGKVPLRPA
jgi:methyl-accepting chemotaxis protein